MLVGSLPFVFNGGEVTTPRGEFVPYITYMTMASAIFHSLERYEHSGGGMVGYECGLAALRFFT